MVQQQDLTAGTGRTSLGGTTIGQNYFTLTNPGAITFIRQNADNSLSSLNAGDFRTAIGAGTGSGDIDGITTAANSGLAGGTTSGTATLTLDVENSTTSTTSSDADWFAIANTAGTTYKMAPGNIDLSTMNNDSGWTSSAGVVTTLTTTGTSGAATLVGATLNIPNYADDAGVTAVTATSPVLSSEGTTPVISMPAATTSVSGYLTTTDWNTFNNKGSGDGNVSNSGTPLIREIAEWTDNTTIKGSDVLKLNSTADGLNIFGLASGTSEGAANVLGLYKNDATGDQSITFHITADDDDPERNQIWSKTDDTTGELGFALGVSVGGSFENQLILKRGTGVLLPEISEIGSDTDKFLMVDDGNDNAVKFVTGANLRSYIGAGTGDGTVTGVTSATTSQLTVSESSPAPALTIVTGAVTNGGTALATGDQIYDATTTRLGSYLPLAGGTMTGTSGVFAPDDFKFIFGGGSDMKIYSDGSNGLLAGDSVQITNAAGDVGAEMHHGGVHLQFQGSDRVSPVDAGVEITGNVILQDDGNIVLDTSIAANQSSGITIKIGTTTLVVNKVYRYSALNTWTQTDNTTAASAGASGLLGYASVGGVASTVGIVTQGVVFDSGHGFAVGGILYLTTSGNLTTTIPTTTNNTLRIMGYALTADEIYFDPDNTYIQLA